MKVALSEIFLEVHFFETYGRKWRRTEEPLDETETGEWKR